MLNSAKILLTVYFRGRFMPGMKEKRQDQLTFIKKEDQEALKNTSNIHIERILNEGHTVAQRKSSISEESYNLFIDKNEVPASLQSYIGKIAWKKWSNKQRLEWHLEQIAEGHPFTYEYTN